MNAAETHKRIEQLLLQCNDFTSIDELEYGWQDSMTSLAPYMPIVIAELIMKQTNLEADGEEHSNTKQLEDANERAIVLERLQRKHPKEYYRAEELILARQDVPRNFMMIQEFGYKALGIPKTIKNIEIHPVAYYLTAYDEPEECNSEQPETDVADTEDEQSTKKRHPRIRPLYYIPDEVLLTALFSLTNEAQRCVVEQENVLFKKYNPEKHFNPRTLAPKLIEALASFESIQPAAQKWQNISNAFSTPSDALSIAFETLHKLNKTAIEEAIRCDIRELIEFSATDHPEYGTILQLNQAGRVVFNTLPQVIKQLNVEYTKQADKLSTRTRAATVKQKAKAIRAGQVKTTTKAKAIQSGLAKTTTKVNAVTVPII